MSLKRTIRTFFKDPEPVEALSDIESGVNIVDGVVTIEEPLRSPVQGQNCIGYHYQSYLVTQSPRAPQPTIQKMKEAEVYSPFNLEVEGGIVHVLPAHKSRFRREEHQRLRDQYGKNFHGTEEIIMPGAKVRLKGKVRMVDGKPTMKMSLISVIEKQKISKGVVGDRKKRRRK